MTYNSENRYEITTDKSIKKAAWIPGSFFICYMS